MSALEKNQELKTLTLDETPWVMDAKNESGTEQQLMRFFDENRLQNKLTSTFSSLKKLQNSDGSFSWWQGMKEVLYDSCGDKDHSLVCRILPVKPRGNKHD